LPFVDIAYRLFIRQIGMKRYRPVIHVPRTPLENILEVLAACCLIGFIAVAIWGWLILPAIVPTHFGISGQPDAYGRKGTLLILPVIFLLSYGLLTFLERFPHTYNYPIAITEENAPRQYQLARMLLIWLKLELLAAGIILQWSIIQSATNRNSSSMLYFTFLLPILLLATVIIYMIKARRER
jgi:uncharacterized membrane protein